jgi:hypothetical protein
MLGALTQAEVERFHTAAIAAFDEAVSRQGRSILIAEVAGVQIDIETAGEELMLAIRPALSGITVTQNNAKAARILVYDLEASRVPAPQFDRPIQHLIRWRGECWTESTTGCRVVFHLSDNTLEVFNPATGICVVMVSSVRKLQPWSLAAPLRAPLAMILESHGVYLVHGAAMGSAMGAVLVTGYGGSGKSTATLSCHKAGIPIMGDDYVALRPPLTEGAHPTIHNVFSSLKILPQELGEEAMGQSLYDKRIIFPFNNCDDGLLREAPLVAMIAASIGKTRLTKTLAAAPEEAARIAYASTSLQIPMANEGIYADSILNCARQAGAYRMKFGSERNHAPQMIKDLLAKHVGRSVISPQPAWDLVGALKPVSVIIPIHNGSNFIEEAVASVAEQDYPDLELIIVDDGSTDDLDAALARIRVPFKLIRQSQLGPAAARNAGIRESQGQWIAFLDADDLWTSMALKTMAKDLSLHKAAGVIHGIAVTFRKDPDTGTEVNAYHPRANYPFYIGNGLYRRSAFENVGLFDDTLLHGEDTDWFLRATEANLKIVKISENILKVRMHNTNMTSDKKAVGRGIMQVLQRRIHRNREAQSTKSETHFNLSSKVMN